MEDDDVFMLLKGIIHGNTDIIEDEDMHEYDGTEVIAAFLNVPSGKKQPVVDWDSCVMPSTRGEHVAEYMKAMRERSTIRTCLLILRHSSTLSKRMSIIP